VTATRVLVVEDDPSVRGLLETLLSVEGYSVSTASDGIGGLLVAAAAQPSVIVLDVMMPDLGGVRVLDELAADPELSLIPVVVVTGKVEALPGMRDRLGEEMVLLKPFAVQDLLELVAQITGGPVSQG
jgi:CheY-like chemotaxis protein